MMPNREELAYTARFVDGEGSISINFKKLTEISRLQKKGVKAYVPSSVL